MNVVFLDIDGVIQPHNSFKRFNYMNNNTIKYLSDKYNCDYSKYDSYDVCSVYVDWSKDAVKRLKYILDYTNSRIIISSNWRDPNNKYKMRDLLKIQELDKYWVDDNPYIISGDSCYKERASEINASINKHDINNYVILDDMAELIRYFPDNFVCTRNFINEEDVDRSIKILKK